MGRIVDAEQFFPKYRCDPTAENVTIAFEIEDHFLPWNNKTVTVLFHRGECSLSAAAAKHHVKLSIATLTALMLGYKTATKLQRLGRIEGEERTVRLLDDVLLHEAPYISDYI